MAMAGQKKARTRERILASARRGLRTRGLRGASVERVMRGAGLTVGGFYAHFASKQALVAEALRDFMSEARVRWLSGLGAVRGAALADAFLARYLSRENRDSIETGCLVPSVASELGYGRSEPSRVFASELGRLLEALAAGLDGTPSARKERALALVALAVGGLTLARMLRGTPRTDAVLVACRRLAHEALTR